MANFTRKYDYQGVFTFICNYKASHDGNSPTLRRIMTEFNMSSTSVVVNILKQLEVDGYITIVERNIHVVGGSWSYKS